MFEKILIANRGEIALRIIRACREMGIRSVAVYSDADRNSLHVQYADEAFNVGPPPPLESYLDMEKIVAVAKSCGAQAIHPGYGFLAENHEFAALCEKEGVEFIGPPSSSLKLVGDKVAARRTMTEAGVPMIPGTIGTSDDVDGLIAEAKSIGFPLILKAALGGGGKGMRTVRGEEELSAAIEASMREARSAFGVDTVYVEKYIEKPRHVEFQVLADGHGNIVHLFERECSIQRRHQKIVEETPSTALTPELRDRMGKTAVKVAGAADYVNAGTVEFLLDADGNFYFLEVNARIQVEHPITELVTGVDLVKWQMRIASGEKLSLEQKNLSQRGHAIECRIYAEDPESNFLPSSGEIKFVHEPSGPGIRCDSGLFNGCNVPIYYDPILSKLVVWAEDREQARSRMIAALDDYVIVGVKNQVRYLRDVIANPEFASGNTNTAFIEDYMAGWNGAVQDDDYLEEALAAAAIGSFLEAGGALGRASRKASTASPWQILGRWEIGSGK